jgi:hypothetical protein
MGDAKRRRNLPELVAQPAVAPKALVRQELRQIRLLVLLGASERDAMQRLQPVAGYVRSGGGISLGRSIASMLQQDELAVSK